MTRPPSAPPAGRRPIAREPIRTDRIRRIDGGFAYVPHRLIRDGFYAALTREEAALYLLLVLVGDRNGVSYYHYDRLSSLLQIDPDAYADARDGLIDQDLIAFDGTRFQILSLPERPVRPRPPAGEHDISGEERTAIRRSARAALAGLSSTDAD